MPSNELLDRARRWWLLLLAAALVAGTAGNLAARRVPEKYASEVRLLVGPLNGDTDTLRASGLLAQTYAAVLISDEVLRNAADAAGLPADQASLAATRDAVAVTASDKTRLLTITVTFASAERARLVAASLTRQLEGLVSADMARTERLLDAAAAAAGSQGPSSALQAVHDEGHLTVVDAPQLPQQPVSSPVLLYTLLAGLAGAGLAFAAVLMLGRRRGPGLPGLTAIVNRRLLGTCRLDGRSVLGGRHRRLVSERRPESPGATDYRLIAAKAELLAPIRPLSSLALFGGRHATGSGEVAANLALTFARTGRSVALVDLTGTGAALDRLGLSEGVREVQRIGDDVLETCVRPVGRGQVVVLLSHDPALRTQPAGPAAIVDVLSGISDLVILHAPPLLLEPTTVLVASQVDGVVIVAAEDEGEDAVEGVADAIDALERVDAPVLGTVLVQGKPGRGVRRREAEHDGSGSRTVAGAARGTTTLTP